MVLTTLVDGLRETRELEEGSYVIGRGASCRIRFDVPDVSERHAILTIRDGRAILEDLHSANGTFVNGERVEMPALLDSNIVVQIGSCLLRVSQAAEIEEPKEQEFDNQPNEEVSQSQKA